jgi:hypothetical protein
MQSQGMAPVAFIPLAVLPLIPFGWVVTLIQSAQVRQVARANNRSIIAGNLAAVTTGAQTASPTNVNGP